MLPVLEVTEFTVRRAPDWSVALPSLVLASGEVAALYGPSGGGKTSLQRALFGLQDRGASAAGIVRFAGRDWHELAADERRRMLREQVAFLVQGARAALDPLATVLTQVQLATGASAEAVAQVLHELGITAPDRVASSYPHQLAGGEAQRVLLAMAFLRRPALVIADEPSADLDGKSRGELVRHLRTLITRGSAVLLATHDHALLVELHAQVFALHAGRFVPGEFDAAPWPVVAEVAVGAPALTGSGLTARVGGRVLFAGLDLTIASGESVALVGDSGAGKTTLARLLAGHQRPDAGHVQRPARRAAVQLVCQDAFSSLTPGRSLGSLCAETRADPARVQALVRALRLPDDVLGRTSAQLSGGECRRAALLRALVVDPQVLLLDEPSNGLDRRSSAAMLEVLLAEQQRRGMALLVVTHDLELARAVAHRILRLQGGRLCTESFVSSV